MNILTCFKDVVGIFDLPFSVQQNDELKHRALEIQALFPRLANWYCKTYTTAHSGYNMFEDLKFASLIKKITESVNLFSQQFDIQTQATCNDAWINIANPSDYQEFHCHPRRHFSAVYYIFAKPNSGNIIFGNPRLFSDTFGFPKTDTNELNTLSFYVRPLQSRLVVFRSNMTHMVAANESNDIRISASFNFSLQD